MCECELRTQIFWLIEETAIKNYWLLQTNQQIASMTCCFWIFPEWSNIVISSPKQYMQQNPALFIRYNKSILSQVVYETPNQNYPQKVNFASAE